MSIWLQPSPRSATTARCSADERGEKTIDEVTVDEVRSEMGQKTPFQ